MSIVKAVGFSILGVAGLIFLVLINLLPFIIGAGLIAFFLSIFLH